MIKKFSGFTLVETLITMGIFMVFSSIFYLAYSNISSALVKSRQYAAAVSVLENEIETIRKMDYADIGISGGYPPGKIPAEKIVVAGNINFVVNVTVRNIDDPFDGTATTIPADTAPADYKTAELKISCSNCPAFGPVKMTTTVAPKNLESASNNGSLFINVFDANGQPVIGANVSVANNSLSPTIAISDLTNNGGVLQLVDIPTSTSAYEISVSKFGYSSDRTYQSGAPENPNPTKPHATVASQQVTSISFAIDKVSVVNFKTTDSMCAAAPNIDFLQQGVKLIGTAPDILKYAVSSTTGASGVKTIGNLEWDTYGFSNLDGAYDLSGYLPAMP
ncbi:MAG: prepilin-type N-terminal cleavage/methylation domain-containing protein, partial [Patescibacteria group bacterium]